MSAKDTEGRIERLDEILALGDDWDGGGARAVTPAAGKTARAVLAALSEAASTGWWAIFPTYNGGVSFEQVSVEQAWVGDIEAEPDGRTSIHLLDMEGDGTFGSVHAEPSEAVAHLLDAIAKAH